jgi:acyl dehydratase
MRVIGSIAELKELVGREVGTSAWVDMPQERIQLFADATGDRQWIHVDPERCRNESPFGAPVAHGFLTLSLFPVMMASTLTLPPCRLGVNYGLNRVRFPAPVPAGSRVRARIALLDFEEIDGGAQLTWAVTIECEGSDKPVCVAESVARIYW